MRWNNLAHQICKTLFFTSLPLTLVAVMPSTAQAAAFSRIYAFGDSLTDTGNSWLITQQANLINNQIPVIPPSEVGYSQGRFSNGPIWLDRLASRLGITPPPVSVIAGGNSPIGINFAINSATTGEQNTFPIPGLPGYVGLQTQITQFRAANSVADPQALYILWAGANDYLGLKVQQPSVPVDNLAIAVNNLYDAGARNFLVVNLPLLGYTPLATSRVGTVNQGLNLLSAAHNSLLSETLGQLKNQKSGINLKTLDVGSLFQAAIDQPSKFNLTNVKDPCLQNSPLFPDPNSPLPPTICNNPDEYLFWDVLHPTSAAHRYIGDLAYKTLVPEPSMILSQLAFGAFLGAMAIRKRKFTKVMAMDNTHRRG